MDNAQQQFVDALRGVLGLRPLYRRDEPSAIQSAEGALVEKWFFFEPAREIVSFEWFNEQRRRGSGITRGRPRKRYRL